MHSGKQLSTEIDATVPTAARMYDYYLGGKDNYAADRAAVEELDKVVPSTRRLALNNRRFLQRVVRTLTQEYGIRQYLDHGSGLPTQDNVHQVAQRIDPTTHVVYADNDPMVLVHGRALLEQDERTVVIQADMRDTDGIFGHPETQRLINFDEPVCVLFNSVFHCIPDSDTDGPLAVANRVREAGAGQLHGDVPAGQRGPEGPRVRHQLHGPGDPGALGPGPHGEGRRGPLRRPGDPGAGSGGGVHLASGHGGGAPSAHAGVDRVRRRGPASLVARGT